MATQQRKDLDIDYFRDLLKEERRKVELVINGTRNAEELAGDGSDLDPDPADSGANLQMQEQDMALISNSEQILARIERALEKIEEGTYGLSDRSGKPIPKERLEVLPYATETVDEQI